MRLNKASAGLTQGPDTSQGKESPHPSLRSFLLLYPNLLLSASWGAPAAAAAECDRNPHPNREPDIHYRLNKPIISSIIISERPQIR